MEILKPRYARPTERADDIFKRILNGETYVSIAAIYNVSIVRIRQLFQRYVRMLKWYIRKISCKKEKHDVPHEFTATELRINKDYWLNHRTEWMAWLDACETNNEPVL